MTIMMMLMTMVLMMMMMMVMAMVMTLMLMVMMVMMLMMIFLLRGATSSSALATTDRQVRLAGTARGRCAPAGLNRPGHLAGPGADTRLRMVTLVDDDGEGHIELVHVVASASLVQAVEHHLGKRRNSTSSDFE